jgi:hypothetical protein
VPPLKGIVRIEVGIEDWRATGNMIDKPLLLALKAEALHLSHRTPEALQTITEAQTLIERLENRYWSAELHRLRGVFLAALGADETKIATSFCAAVNTANQQKSISLTKRRNQLMQNIAGKKRTHQETWIPGASLLTPKCKRGNAEKAKARKGRLPVIMQSIFRPAGRREMLGEHSGGGRRGGGLKMGWTKRSRCGDGYGYRLSARSWMRI